MIRPRLPWLIPARWTPSVAQMTLALVIAGVLWRVVRYLAHFPIWGDEAFVAINFIARDYAGMVKPLVYGQIVSLGYMWATLAVTQLFGVDEYSLRLVSLLTGIGALLVFWRFAVRVLPARGALLAVGLLAASMYAVRHGAEVKPYTTDLFVSMVLTALAWAVWRRPRSLATWCGLVVAAGLAPWCSYPSLFILGGVGVLLTLLMVRERYAPAVVAGWIIGGLVLAVSSYAMYVVIAKPHAEYAAKLVVNPMWTLAFPPWGEPWKLPLWFFAIHTGLMFAYPHGGTFGGSVITFVLFVIGAIWLWRRQPALVVLLLTPFLLNLLAASFERYPYGGTVRTSIYLAPAICLLAGAGAYALIQRFLRGVERRLALVSVTVVLVGFSMVGAVADVAKPYTSKSVLRSYEAVRELASQGKPSDRWVTFNADREVSYAPFLGDWRGIGGQWVFDTVRFAPCELTWAPPPEEVQLPPNGALWLFAYRGIKVPWPEAQWQAYYDQVVQRLGAPEHRSYYIKDRDGMTESIEVYHWAAGR